MQEEQAGLKNVVFKLGGYTSTPNQDGNQRLDVGNNLHSVTPPLNSLSFFLKDSSNSTGT